MAMTKMVIGAVICLLFVLPSAGSAGELSQVGWSKKRLQDLYVTYLKKEGYGPAVDRDGEVGFEWEDHPLFVAVSEDDPLFFRLVLPNIVSFRRARRGQ